MKKASTPGQQLYQPFGTFPASFKRALHRIQRLIRPPFPWVAILGVDGCGKTSVLRQLRQNRAALPFAGIAVFHRRPGIAYGIAKGGSRDAIEHYGKPPHGLVKSVLKLAAMVIDWHMGYWGWIWRQRAQGYLVVADRHALLDMLVDPLRYRYAGPPWLVRLATLLVPRPGIVLLLDAPTEILQARKQELAAEEAAQLRQAYLKLIRRWPSGRIIDASKPLEQVTSEVKQTILAGRDSPGISFME